MNPDATGFQTGRLNKLNRRGPSRGPAGERGFPREFAGGAKRVPTGRVSVCASTLGTRFGSRQACLHPAEAKRSPRRREDERGGGCRDNVLAEERTGK